jgi:hypothetical protein
MNGLGFGPFGRRAWFVGQVANLPSVQQDLNLLHGTASFQEPIGPAPSIQALVIGACFRYTWKSLIPRRDSDPNSRNPWFPNAISPVMPGWRVSGVAGRAAGQAEGRR